MRKNQQPLPDEYRWRLLDIVRAKGLGSVTRRFGLSRNAMLAALAGLRLQHGTRFLIITLLDRERGEGGKP